MQYRLKNPFRDSETDRYKIWEMLVRRDITTFIRQDWSVIEDDFIIENFMEIDADDRICGETIEEQTKLTLENCSGQLNSAMCSLDDLFKVNVYLNNLDDWPRFNEINKEYFFEPLPVRTAIQTGLLDKLLVEIEMWAVKG